MANPDYASILAQIAAATDPAVIAALKAQLVVLEELTEQEKELFEYAAFDYIEYNPGYNNDFKSYVGVYFDDEGNET